jgi:catechol 2,3-dioxygenase-like lactoylglutathione lyase family enzyme
MMPMNNSVFLDAAPCSQTSVDFYRGFFIFGMKGVVHHEFQGQTVNRW